MESTPTLLLVLLALIAGALSALPAFLFLQRKFRRVERKLQETQARLEAIFDSTEFGIAISTLQGDYLAANACWCEKLGYDEGEICRLTHTQITHPEDIEISRERLAALASGKVRSYAFEKRYLCKDGRIFWAMLSATPIKAADGRIVAVLGIMHDIDENKLLRLRLQRIIQQIPIALLVVAEGERMEHINDTFLRQFGYSRDEIDTLDNWRMKAYPDPDYRAKLVETARSMVEQSRQSGRSSGPHAVRTRCKNGTDKDIELHYVDLEGLGIWTLTDVTEHHALAKAMQQANEHLLHQLAEIRDLQDLLRDQAMRDGLTGLFNRRYLDEILERELARAMREGYPLTVAMLDIDHFKRLNDTYGHQAGDEVLKALGRMLRENARAEDIPCRYGGEEFLLVLPNMSLEHARQRAEEWRILFEEMRTHFGQFTLSSTMSIGLATFPGHGRTRDQLIDAADRALYSAKNNGRNRVEACPD